MDINIPKYINVYVEKIWQILIRKLFLLYEDIFDKQNCCVEFTCEFFG